MPFTSEPKRFRLSRWSQKKPVLCPSAKSTSYFTPPSRMRTLSGAVATSIVTTSWESKTQVMHSELAGMVDRSGEVTRTLGAGGMDAEQTRQVLDNLTQSQSVMLATNEIMAFVSLAFFLSALLIWAAPKPTRAVQLGAAH